MRPYARGKNVFFREVTIDDAGFLLQLRTDPSLSRYISPVSDFIEDQKKFIYDYLSDSKDYYFIITDCDDKSIGTIRIYDIVGDSFCWGSWILTNDAPAFAAVESALLVYDFSFFSLHYRRSCFDVRKANTRVVAFHERFGARIVKSDNLNFYFEFDLDTYLAVRTRYRRFLP